MGPVHGKPHDGRSPPHPIPLPDELIEPRDITDEEAKGLVRRLNVASLAVYVTRHRPGRVRSSVVCMVRMCASYGVQDGSGLDTRARRSDGRRTNAYGIDSHRRR